MNSISVRAVYVIINPHQLLTISCRLVRSCRDQRHFHQGELTRPVSAVTSVDLLLTGPLASIHVTQQEDQEFLIRNNALEDQGRVRAVETGKQPTSVRSTVRTSY